MAQKKNQKENKGESAKNSLNWVIENVNIQ